MEGGLFLDVVIWQSSAILKLFSGKNQTLLVWRDTFFVLDFGFDILNGVRGFNFKGDGLASQSFDENLHGDFFKVLKWKLRVCIQNVEW